MKKAQISYNGRTQSETWDIVEMRDVVGLPHLGDLELSRNDSTMQLRFNTTDEKQLFRQGVGMCRATYLINGTWQPIYITRFGRE